jgi:uncharacterized protein YegP (UPF0339 family)
MPYARVLLGDRFGAVKAETRASIGPISERLNKYGRTTLELSKKDTKATEGNLQFGNRIFIQFDNGLPDWGGIIDPPRTWTHDSILITAYSAEYMLDWRITNKTRAFSGDTAGAIFTSIVNEANAVDNLGIVIGNVWGGGSGHSPVYHFDDALEIIQDSVTGRLSNADFDISASLVNGKILFTANLYERRGSDKPGVALIDKNTFDVRLIEQGKIVNEWIVAGADITGDDISGWGDGRIVSDTKRDIASVSKYGLRQGNRVFNDIVTPETLNRTADDLIDEFADPHNILDLKALNLAPALYADYGVGDSITVQLIDFGFNSIDALFRVLAREYDPVRGTVSLILREQ